MDLSVIKAFFHEQLKTKAQVQRAADVIGVSIATMYRYKAAPGQLSLDQAVKLSDALNLPLANVAIWKPAAVREAELRRLDAEEAIAKAGGQRLQFVPAYTVNSELPEVTRMIMQADYGTRLTAIEAEMMELRARRAQLYEAGSYESWEIWSGHGYLDFFLGENRFKSIPKELRERQVEKFVESSLHPKRHRFAYLKRSPDLPMFGCFKPPSVAIIRVDNVQLEHRDQMLVDQLEDCFNSIRKNCGTATPEEFVRFLRNPQEYVE